jgi:hypothetical protein
LECLVAGRSARSAFDGVYWQEADASRIVEDAASKPLVGLQTGKGLQPIDLRLEPEIQSLISPVDVEELRA